MASRGKKYRNVREKVDSQVKYPLDEAVQKVHDLHFAKFDESVDTAIRLNVNPKYADQMIRGAAVLPHGTGKTVRVLVFAKGEKEAEALGAGADFAGGDELIEKVKGGWMDFDKVIATPDMMGSVGKIGRVLGPRGLMPNPKVGSVTFDVANAVKEMKGGRIEFKVEKAGIIHCSIGKVSFDAVKLKENFLELLNVLLKLRPSSVKGSYITGLTLNATMGPGIRVDVNSAIETLV